VTPGVSVLSVDHDGNSTDSPEEADAIVAEIGRLLGTRGPTRRHPAVGAKDVLIVTPYNAQVVTLRRRLDARRSARRSSVGTVDKFQGRQAAVVSSR